MAQARWCQIEKEGLPRVSGYYQVVVGKRVKKDDGTWITVNNQITTKYFEDRVRFVRWKDNETSLEKTKDFVVSWQPHSLSSYFN